MPTTIEASQKYGRGSTWCTAAMGTRNYFDDYRKRRYTNLYYILPKIDMGDEKYTKVAVAVYPNGNKEYYDYCDRSMNTSEFDGIKKQLDIPG